MKKKIVLVGVLIILSSMFFIKTKIELIEKEKTFNPSIITENNIPSEITEDTLIKKGTYQVKNNTTIHENVTVMIEAGTIITVESNKTITIKGTLLLNGTEEENIKISNRHDISGYPLTITSTGTFEANYTDITNPLDNTMYYGAMGFISNAGNLKLNHVTVNTHKDKLNSISNSGSVEITDSILPSDITISGDNQIKIENNTILGTLQISLNTSTTTTFSNIKNNVDKENNQKTIKLIGNPTQDVTLTENKYQFSDSIIIPENTALTIEAGTILTSTSMNKTITVQGVLKFNGTENKRIKLNYSHDARTIDFITIKSGGTFEANYTDITNPNNTKPYGTMRVITNRGTLKLNHSSINTINDIVNNISNSGNIEITNSTLSSSISTSGNHSIKIEDNTMLGTMELSLNTSNALTLKDIKNNKNKENKPISITLLGSPTTDVRLYQNNYLIENDITIPENTILEVDAGTLIQGDYFSRLFVKGMLYLNGTKENQINLTSMDDSNYGGTDIFKWPGIRVETTGTMISNNTNFRLMGDESDYALENSGNFYIANAMFSACAKNKAIYNSSNDNTQLIRNSYILGNVYSSKNLNAAYNYWGTENGPKRTGGGSGYTVSDNVNIYPYHTSFIRTDEETPEILKIKTITKKTQDGVNTFNGLYTNKEDEIELEDFSITRTYRFNENKIGTLGKNWNLNISSKIEPHPYTHNLFIVNLPNGTTDILEKIDTTYQSLFFRNKIEVDENTLKIKTPDQKTYIYQNNQLISMLDKYQNKIELQYQNNQITKITYKNRNYHLEYNQDNLLSKIIDPLHREITYTYNTKQELKKVNKYGIETVYQYNELGLLTKIIKNNITKEELEYDKEKRIQKRKDEKGNTFTYSYDTRNLITTKTDTNNNITKDYYDKEGYLIKKIDPLKNETLITYTTIAGINRYGEEQSVTDINTNKTSYIRNQDGFITKITNPSAKTKQYFYNDTNSIIKEIDELGNQIEYIYATDGITLLKEVKPLNGTTNYSESLDQNLFEIKTYTYYPKEEVNNIHNLIKTQTNHEGTTSYTYNNYGDIITKTDGNGYKTVYTKNELGWIISEKTEDKYVTNYQYDNRGNVTLIKKASNLISKTEYNSNNLPTKIMDGNCIESPTIDFKLEQSNQFQTNETTNKCTYQEFIYDNHSNLIKEIDREGNETNYEYDIYGNKTKKITPNLTTYLYTYDALNRLEKTYLQASEPILLEEKSYIKNYSVTTKSYIDKDTYKTTIEGYNFRNQLTSETIDKKEKNIGYYANGLKNYEKDRNSSYTYYYYNKANHLEKKYEQIENNLYIYTGYTYDNKGNLITEKKGKEKVRLNETPTTFIITNYTYDNVGNRIKKTTSSGEEINYTYDALKNLITEQIKIDNDTYRTIEYEYNYRNQITTKKIGDQITTYTYDEVGNKILETSGENKKIEYTYDKNANLIKTTINDILKEELTYDNIGNIIKRKDGNNHETEYFYDNQNNLIKEKNPKGIETTYTYDFLGRITSSKDAKETITNYTYDSLDNITKKVVGDRTYLYTYDNNKNLLKETTPLGFITTYTYDYQNKIKTKIDALGNKVEYFHDTNLNNTVEVKTIGAYYIYTYHIYDERNNLISERIQSDTLLQNEYNLANEIIKTKDGNQNETTYVRDNYGNIIKKTNPLGYIEEYTYNKNNELIKKVDNLGKEVIYTYDKLGNIIKEVEQKQDGSEKITTQKEYDNNGNLIKEIDGNNNITTYTYDSLNNLIKIKNALNEETIKEYDNNNNLIKETNHLGDSKTYQYDIYNQLIIKKNESNEIEETLEYDLDGRQIKSTDALNHTTTYTYDSLNQLMETKDALEQKETMTYNTIGNLIKKTDKNGNTTSYQYDTRNNIIKVTNALNEATSYTYDFNNNLLKITYPNNKTTEYIYDALNNKLTEKDSLGNIETNLYDSNGLLKKKTNKNQTVINYTYDIHNRLLTENDITYTYDNNNNITKIEENDNIIIREYDALNRTTKKIENGLTSTYTYSDYQEKTIDPKGNETIKLFDASGRLKKVNNQIEYNYNLDGTLKKVIYPNNITEEYFYNNDKTLQKLTNKNNDTTEEYTYLYDSNKNIIKKIDKGEEINYTYDSLNRLKTIEKDGIITTYTYDALGNRISETTTNKTKNYTYNANNQLLKITELEDNNQIKVTEYQYDKNGNQIKEIVDTVVTKENTYNNKNELIKVKENNKETTYIYNPEGKRIEKNSDKIIKYIYEGNNIILELDNTNTETARNIYGNNLISRTTDNKTGYYLYNGHGDVVTIIDSNNQILNEYTYDEFGNIIKKEETLDNPYTYAGYYYDIETNNYYLLSRYYNPVIARFITEDTYHGKINDPLSLNRYVYVNNNPLIYIDPTGYFLKELDWLGKRANALIQGTLELGYDVVKGIATTAYDTGKFIGSGLGIVGNYYIHELGFTSKETYTTLNDAYMKTFTEKGEMLLNLPSNIITGVKNNFETTFNWDNFTNYITTDNYNEIKDYSKSVVQTGTTLYGGYKVGQAAYNKINSIIKNNQSINNSFTNHMNTDDVTRYNQYWDDVKNGLTAEQRYNYQLYKDVAGSANYKINVTKSHSINKYGEAGSITRKIDNNGIIQDRIYGPDGQTLKDIDFYHTNGKNHFFPHEHYFDWNEKIPRAK